MGLELTLVGNMITRDREIALAVSIPVFQEYRDVLSRSENRKQLGLSTDDVDAILLFIATVGRPTDIS
ncbi:hypothetical protein LCGC14_1817420 [marine sediment metagenome]|uniref:Uncharacterized protein n=1 Tax=marine sediment metagenome TaxID=412755 RepID=A0A0F9IZP9_9ZZZZ